MGKRSKIICKALNFGWISYGDFNNKKGDRFEICPLKMINLSKLTGEPLNIFLVHGRTGSAI